MIAPTGSTFSPLGSVATLQRGFDLPKRLRRTGQIPIITSAGATGTHNAAMVPGPGVVTGRYGTIGKVFFVDEPFWPLNTTLWVSDFHGCDEKFISYLLQRVDFESHSGKSGVPGVNRNDLHHELVWVPELVEEQIVVAGAMSDADDLIEALERFIEKKQAIKQGMMQQLLTGKTRLPGFSAPWEQTSLGEIANVRDGTHQTPNYTEAGVPFYSVENVTADSFSHPKFISEEAHAELTRSFRIEKGDILMTRIGSIGVCKLVDWDVRASFYVSLALLKIKDGISASFVAQYSGSARFQNEIESHSLLSAIPKKINLGPISDVRIDLPSDRVEQDAIAELLSDVDQELELIKTRLIKAKAIKQGMMQELLTGRTRLPVKEEAE